MTPNPFPLIELGWAWTAPYTGLVSFVLWNIAREHRLNVDAFAAHMQHVAATWPLPMRTAPSSRRKRDDLS